MSILIVTLILLLYGTAVSWAEERTEMFHKLSAGPKQYTNALLTFVVPCIATVAVRLIYPELRILTFGPISQLLYISIPVVAWIASQVAHYFDPFLWCQCGEGKLEHIEEEALDWTSTEPVMRFDKRSDVNTSKPKRDDETIESGWFPLEREGFPKE